MPTDRDEVAALAAQIRRYLEARPAAADTLDGILRWWLPRQRYTDAAESVQRALDALVAAGVVEQVRRSDGHVIYRRTTTAPGQSTPPEGKPDA
jgi:Fe2+ or Zn2+ uptake regulation protein